MHDLLLMNPDDKRFDAKAIERIFESEHGFGDMRFNEPGGALIEADYIESEGRTIVELSGNRRSIALSGTSDVALRAVLILQRNLDSPLRMVDTDYSFDLILEGLSTVEELRDAIERARTS
jgi:hypothetical protein